ncbi:MAG: UDP-N-acetylmuramoyl-tripeptide--D-alanyl-D-alanine ligase [Elusimicrobiales bacterium]
MKLDIKPDELAKIIEGDLIHLSSKKMITKFSTDTRTLKKGDIFWALKGKNFDGNDFVNEAINKGAIGIISSRKSDLYYKTDFYILCKDTLQALHKLTEYHFSRFKIKTISVTGSNGKTTTKEMIKNLLSAFAPTVSNLGNFNNEYGLPLSVLETEKKHKYAVFEIGSSSCGEIQKLSKLIKPDIAVITTIAVEHMEFFKNIKNVFKEETSVIKNLKKDGIIIINGDNIYLRRLKQSRKDIISFGYQAHNDLIIKDEEKSKFFIYKSKKYRIKLKHNISHSYLNAAAAFIVLDVLGLSLSKSIRILERFEGVPMRMQMIKRRNSILIFDAYNANPQSMKYALIEISKMRPFAVVLGDMKELGSYSLKEHINAAKLIEKIEPEYTFLIGHEIKPAYDYLKNRIKNIKYYNNTEDAVDEVKRFIDSNKELNILIKASRSMRFERFVDLKH